MKNTIPSTALSNSIDAVIRNPNAMQRITLDLLESLTGGEIIPVDPNNPFVYINEVAAVMASTGLDRVEAGIRKLYPSMAQNEDDLYRHMATPDFLNRFAKPGSTTIGFVMQLSDVIGRAVPLNDGTGARALIVPKHTQIQKDNLYFTLQYPLVIKVLFNGTLSIYLDTSEELLNWTVLTNSVPWREVTLETNQDILLIDVPVQQVRISSQIIQVTSFTGFSRNISFDDQFHHARAYIKNRTTNQWDEITVTHTKQIYDSKTPTVCLRVLNGSVDVYIPQIYFANGSIRDAIRLDIYTTLGPVDMDITELGGDNLRLKFVDLDNGELQKYSAPLDAFSMFAAFIRSRIAGGSSPVTFLELRRRVVSRSVVTAGLPITPNQMGSALYDMGFEMNTTLDNITDRQYTAIRAVDPPADETTVTGLGCSIQLVSLTLQELTDSGMVIDTPRRVVITPGTLFKVYDGYIKIVPKDEYDRIIDMTQTSPDGTANLVNSEQFYFTPFHYVLDTTNELFTVRPYQLNAPVVDSSMLFQQNDSLGVDIRSESYTIGMNPDGSGYSLFVTLKPNASLKMIPVEKITAQLSYNPKDSTKRAFISGSFISPIETNGRPVGDKWIYRFDLDSNFDVNAQDQLMITNTGYPVELIHEMDVVFVVENFQPQGAQPSDIDTIISIDHIPGYSYLNTYFGLTQEKVRVEFGKHLKNLWRRSRTLFETIEYQTYPEDVPSYYTQDMYLRDKNGNIITKYDFDTSQIVQTITHKKGDPVVDVEGKPVLKHRKGDYVLGPDQQPIPLQTDRNLGRELDLFLVDGRYFFATNEATQNYLKKALDQIVTWITEDIAHLSQRCLERTDLYFYPKSSVGLIDVIVGDGTKVRLPADQKFTVKYTVRKDKYNNPEIRDNLRDSAAKTILSALTSLEKVTGGAITKNDIISTIKNLHRDDVIDVELGGFLDDRYNAALITDMSSIPSIGKKLVTMSNLTLQVQDDVTVEWEILDADKQLSRYAQRKEK